MGANSRKWALKNNLPALIHAKDILKLHKIGDPGVQSDILEVCTKAISEPSMLLPFEIGMIHKYWRLAAEAGKLRGIRTKDAGKE